MKKRNHKPAQSAQSNKTPFFPKDAAASSPTPFFSIQTKPKENKTKPLQPENIQTIKPALKTALLKVTSVYTSMSNPKPEAAQKVLSMARKLVFAGLSLEELKSALSGMIEGLSGKCLALSTDADLNDGAYDAYVLDKRKPIYVCPSFFHLPFEKQVFKLIHEAAHVAGYGNSLEEQYWEEMDCNTYGKSKTNGDAWANFILCESPLK